MSRMREIGGGRNGDRGKEGGGGVEEELKKEGEGREREKGINVNGKR